jgi:prostamide/prostaglandin F2alpha synthase
LDRAREEFEAAGANLVLIGQLTPRDAAHFRRRQQIELPVLADEQRRSYRAVGAKIGSLGDLLGPKVVGKGALTTLRTGKLQGRTRGNPAQLGGTIVVSTDGEITWSHMARDAGDNASPEEVLAALPALAAHAS